MGSADSLGADQRAHLYRTKLTSLVRLHFSTTENGAESGAGFSADQVSGYASGAVATLVDRSVILVNDGEGLGAFGAGLLKCRSAAHISVWIDESLPEATRGAIARCSAALTPVDTVELLTGKSLQPAVPAPAVAIGGPISRTDPWVEMMERAGLTVEMRDGDVVGSLRGLEAARIVSNADGTTRLDVGVGRYDQEAFAMMNSGLEPEEALGEVVRQIQQLRVADAGSHPINRLGRTRWLADTIVQDPSRVGLAGAARVNILAEPGIRTEAPVALLGQDSDGERVGVVVAVGLDPAMIPGAADLVVTTDVARLVLVVPQRDRYELLDEMAQMLAVPTTLTSVALPWSEAVP